MGKDAYLWRKRRAERKRKRKRRARLMTVAAGTLAWGTLMAAAASSLCGMEADAAAPKQGIERQPETPKGKDEPRAKQGRPAKRQPEKGIRRKGNSPDGWVGTMAFHAGKPDENPAVDTLFGGLTAYAEPTVARTGTWTDVSPAFGHHGKAMSDWYTRCVGSMEAVPRTLTDRAGGLGTRTGCATDFGGRAMVAVGPNIMNPGHDAGTMPTAEEMRYGTKLDVVLEKDGRLAYLPCVVVDCKAHTYPTGVVQTGYAMTRDGLAYVEAGRPDGSAKARPYDKAAADTNTIGAAAVEFTYVPEPSASNGWCLKAIIVYD